MKRISLYSLFVILIKLVLCETFVNSDEMCDEVSEACVMSVGFCMRSSWGRHIGLWL